MTGISVAIPVIELAFKGVGWPMVIRNTTAIQHLPGNEQNDFNPAKCRKPDASRNICRTFGISLRAPGQQIDLPH